MPHYHKTLYRENWSLKNHCSPDYVESLRCMTTDIPTVRASNGVDNNGNRPARSRRGRRRILDSGRGLESFSSSPVGGRRLSAIRARVRGRLNAHFGRFVPDSHQPCVLPLGEGSTFFDNVPTKRPVWWSSSELAVLPKNTHDPRPVRSDRIMWGTRHPKRTCGKRVWLPTGGGSECGTAKTTFREPSSCANVRPKTWGGGDRVEEK